MGREGRIVKHRPKNFKAKLKKEIEEMVEMIESIETTESIEETELEKMIEKAEVMIKEFEEISKEEEEEKEDFIIEENMKSNKDERVICVNTNKVYDNNKIASVETGVNASSIKRCCNGNSSFAGKNEEGEKLVWKYVKDL